MNSLATSVAPSSAPGTGRLAALDQYRGYTVLGMLLVNYFGNYEVCPQVLRHTHDYCSYADTIMPQFLFAVGFAMRLTVGRRLGSQGHKPVIYGRMIRRLLGLVLVSLIVYNVGARAAKWDQLVDLGFWGAIAEPLKRDWFQTLMHIAVTSLWILPVIGFAWWVRIFWMVGSAGLHVYLSYLFNFVWCNTSPNAIDGGPLGFLTWTIPAIVGTLACDAFVSNHSYSNKRNWAVFNCLLGASFLMFVGYALSCGTRYYDVPADQVEAMRAEKLAKSPVWPTPEQVAAMKDGSRASQAAEAEQAPVASSGEATSEPGVESSGDTSGGETESFTAALSKINWQRHLAEPPFVKPPTAELRKWNYWMMSQRAGTLTYLLFSAGFGLLMFVVFYIACDRMNLRLRVFETFGTNALAAYILHSMVSSAVQPFFPKDSPAWYALSGLALFFVVNWVCLRSLEKQDIYLRV